MTNAEVDSTVAEVIDGCPNAVMLLDETATICRLNAAARALGFEVGGVPCFWSERSGGVWRAVVVSPDGSKLVHAPRVRRITHDGSWLVALHPDQTPYLDAWVNMTEVLLSERESSNILDAFARIAGETLEVDRSLIYEVRLDEQVVVALSEWLNPASKPEPTKATYPMSAFARAEEELRATRRPLESHAGAPNPVLDGAAELLHGQMAIASLLWYPFDFRDNRYSLLVFNQVSAPRRWAPHELTFLRGLARHVELALMQIAWHEERAEAARMLFEAQKAESIRVLAGGVAHDFNNLLGIVIGALRQLRGRADRSVVLDELQRAERAAGEASDLARQLLAYSGSGQFVLGTHDLAEVIEEMRDLLSSAAQRVTISFALRGPALVKADVSQLRQVALNFVVNAAEAVAGRDDPRIDVEVRQDLEETEARFSVRDNGRGMSEEVRARIFEPFFTTNAIGRGLGLAAVSGIVRAHGGRLLVESLEGKGTTMTAVFPRTSLETPTETSEPRGDEPSPEHGPRAGLVLLVDDNRNFRVTCATMLSDLGFEIMEAEDGLSAVAMMETNLQAIDAAVMDWTMPHLDGLQTFSRLRELKPSLPIVVISGFAAASRDALARRERVVVLEKPFAPEALRRALWQSTS